MYTKCVVLVRDPPLPLGTYVDIDLTHMIKSPRASLSIKNWKQGYRFLMLIGKCQVGHGY